jgi:Kelch motif
MLLAGWSSVASAQWTGLANAFPSGFASTCLLLTDGTVMCHEYNTNRWHRLKPDINGSYQNGSWDVPGFTVADMPNGNDPTIGCVNCPYTPLYFASAVLPDGQVVVIGGEYNGGPAVWINIGFLYDPVTNTWSGQIAVPGTWSGIGTGAIGDAQSTVLPNGTMLLARVRPFMPIGATDIASFDPATLTFSALAPTGKDDGNDQENWNILPNGKVLTVDSTTVQRSEVYDPATNAWEAAVDTQVNLADWGAGTVNSAEVGPAILRPDGTIIAFSGTNSGQNAVYSTATGTWAATGMAGDFPVGPGASHYAVADGPASLLPNGNVLVMASPVYPTKPPGVFNTPSHFYEFDGTNLTQVADSPNAASFKSYQGRMLLLPTGEVLLTAYNQNATQDVVLYSNGGGPQDAWRPVITTAPCDVVAGNTYSISGTLFNGFSEGASYGDDAQMSTNYPLVRIINHATGHVFYTRTHDHSRMGVEPVGSSEIVTTQFDVPLGLESGPSDLIVVVNGIPSLPAQVNAPPTITGAAADPSVLWPPNHRMVNVTVSYDVTDNCPLPPGSCTLSVTSNKPVLGHGSGHTSPDWIVVDDHHVLLRAERAGNGNGRIYTITITCTDGGGNSSSEDVMVTVPHDRRR